MTKTLQFPGDKVYFTSDTHFGHTNILRFCNRPFQDVEEMNETLIQNWNQVVGPDDYIFHLGDFAMGGSGLWTNTLSRLNGKKYLVVGNHDFRNMRQKYDSYFEQIALEMYIQIEDQKIYLNHHPFLCYGGSDHGSWQLFGHVHSGPYNTGKDKPRLTMLLPTQYDVGVDNNHYKPISYPEVKAIIERQIDEARSNGNATDEVKQTAAEIV